MNLSPPEQSAPPASARPLFPGWTVRIVIAASLAMVVAVRLAGRLADPPYPFNEPAIRNLLTLVFTFIALFTIWNWVCFFSGIAPLVRRQVLIASVLLIVGFFTLFRFVEVSGDMVPTFTPRWTRTHDRDLRKVETQPMAIVIDLNAISPNDFPQFLGPDRSAWIAGPPLARDWSATSPKLVWKRPIGAGWSAFAAVGGFAITLEQRGDEEWVTCYEIETGEPVWGHSIAARHENPLGGIGPRSTPTIHQGRVYALGATSVLRCLDGASGRLLWQDDLLARYGLTQAEDEAMVQWGRAASPLIVDNLVVVPGGGPRGKSKNLVAFDAQTGTLAWEAENLNAVGIAEQISYASPALTTLAGQRQIVIVNEATASGHVPATGERLWSHPWPGHSNMDANSSQALPLAGDRLLLSKGYSGGAEVLQFTTSAGGDFSQPTSLWKNTRVLQTKFTNIVVRGDHVYGLSEGILECVEAASGHRRWKNGRYRHGQILGVGDLLLVLAEDGRLALVEANPSQFHELASIQALEGKTWNNLCLWGNRLLIRNGQEAACYELP